MDYLAAVETGHLRETTPTSCTSKLDSFVRELRAGPPIFVRVAPMAGARPGWCYANVAQAIAKEGGEKQHGWTIWSCDLWATAEFHVVHQREDGGLVDVTPKPDGEKTILFAVDPTRGSDFDFMQRPPNRRMRLYRGPSVDRRATDLIACMSPAQTRVEMRRAEKARMPLQEFVESRMGADAIEVGIDRFLACCNEVDSLLRPTPEGQRCDDVPRWRQLEERKSALLRRIVRAWEHHPARVFAAAEGSGGPRP